MFILVSLTFYTFVSSLLTEVPPSIIYSSNQKEFSHPNYYPQDTKVEFKCVATGYPPPKYKWFHNDGLILDDGRIVLNEGNLTINQLNYEVDDGVYQCLATNEFGADISKIIKFKTKVIGKFIKDPSSPHMKVNGTIGRPFLIPCPTSSYFYPKIFDWVYPSTGDMFAPLKQDGRVNVLSNGTLFFGYLLSEDVKKINNRGGILCLIYSGDEIRKSNTYDVTAIKGTSLDFAPIFADSISGEVESILGGIVYMQCSAIGKPTPDILWMHNDQVINPNDEGYRLKHANTSLEITVNNRSKAGSYKCRANSFNNGEDIAISAEKTLIVDSKPRWVIEPRNRYVTPGSHVHISCLASGVPKPQHQWYLDGVKVKASHNGSTLTDGILEIENAAGVKLYECHANNSHGTIISKVELTAVFTTTTTSPIKTTTVSTYRETSSDEDASFAKDSFNSSMNLKATTTTTTSVAILSLLLHVYYFVV